MTGYTDCACRDCFEIAMDGKLCSECEEYGCPKGDEECCAPHAYGGCCANPDCCPPESEEVSS